eukprot:492450-Pleurochrysis_carterae.AAC.1
MHTCTIGARMTIHEIKSQPNALVDRCLCAKLNINWRQLDTETPRKYGAAEATECTHTPQRLHRTARSSASKSSKSSKSLQNHRIGPASEGSELLRTGGSAGVLWPDRVTVIVSKPRCGCLGNPGMDSPWYLQRVDEMRRMLIDEMRTGKFSVLTKRGMMR